MGKITIIKHKQELLSQVPLDDTNILASKARQQAIELNKRLGLDASRFEAMTDEQFDAELDFLNEKDERKRNDYRKR